MQEEKLNVPPTNVGLPTPSAPTPTPVQASPVAHELKKSSLGKRFFNLLKPTSTKKTVVLFLIVVVIVGGSYGAFKAYNASHSFAAMPTLTGSDGEFTPLTPARILDTRDGTGGYSAPIGPSQSVPVQVTGVGGVPASHVRAVVMNVTVVSPTAGSYLTIYPTGTALPTASNMNFRPGQILANQVTVMVGPDGKVNLFNRVGSVNVIFDIAGYYADNIGTHGGRYNSLNPARILDTRTGTGGYHTPLNQGQTVPVQVSGIAGVPPAGATAVILNATVTDTTGSSFLTVYPTGVVKPNSSNINFTPGQTIANQVTVKLGADGKLNLYNNIGNTNVIFDVVGYYMPVPAGYANTQSGRFVPLPPARILDTRIGTGGYSHPIGQGQIIPVNIDSQGGIPNTNVSAVAINTTVVNPTGSSYLTVWPLGAPQPTSSNINFVPGQIIANQVTSKVGSNGNVYLYNNIGSTDAIFDVSGYFLADPDSITTSLDSEVVFNNYSYLPSRKLEVDYKPTAIPQAQVIQYIYFATVKAPAVTGSYTFLGINYQLGHSTQINFTCAASETCKSLAPGGVATTDSSGYHYVDIPYTAITAGQSYRLTDEIVSDLPNLVGQWEVVSITAAGVKTPLFARYLGASPGTAFFNSPEFGFMSTYIRLSCSAPQLASFTLSNYLIDGQALTDVAPLVRSGIGGGVGGNPDSFTCPGVSRIDFNLPAPTSMTFSSGLAKADRQTNPPQITSSNIDSAKKTVTVTATDDKAVTNISVSVDGQAISSYYPGSGALVTAMFPAFSPSVTRSFDLTSIAPGAHTLHIFTSDNSGNYSEQNTTINL
jgi:hypothetical protein